MSNFLPFLTKKKKPTIEYIGRNTKNEIQIQLISYNQEILDIANFTPENIKIDDLFKDEAVVSWLNFHGLNNAPFINSINSKLGIDGICTQNILNTFSRPNIEIYNDFIFITIKCLYDNKSEFSTEQMSFVLKDNNLISYQEKKGDHFQHIRDRINEKQGIVRKKTSDYLLFLLLESLVIHYSEIIYSESLNFDTINSKLISEPTPEILKNVELKKQKIASLRRSITPIIEDLEHLIKENNKIIKKENLKYYKDLKNKASRSVDEINELNLKIEGAINLYFSVQSHKMNEVMKTLTIVSSIFIPITFLAGIYGMNFKHIPELQTENGYFIFWGIIILIVLILLGYFKNKKWF